MKETSKETSKKAKKTELVSKFEPDVAGKTTEKTTEKTTKKTVKEEKLKIGIILKDGGFMPEKKHLDDSGFDVRTNKNFILPPMGRIVASTGIYLDIPKGYEVQVRSRSGLAGKNGVFVLNGPGTIDSGYKNEVGIILQNLSKNNFIANKGDRIAQFVIGKVYDTEFSKTDDIGDSDRGTDGFGSTGLK